MVDSCALKHLFSTCKNINEATRQSKQANYIHVLFDHFTTTPSSPQSSILSSLSPDYIFSGHIHRTSFTSHSYTTVDGRERRGREWVVPTCSYRMGESHMGTGAIFIGETVTRLLSLRKPLK